jgi:D-alanyl-D-alanine dipeptidase
MKPYHCVPIVECHEPLVPLLPSLFSLAQPHAYAQLGAPYGDRSPFFVRQGVRECLIAAQTALQQTHPDWRLQIFDAYRPIAVQQFMVEHMFHELARAQGLVLADLTSTQREALYQQVYEFWARPSSDPTMPPPHSTGGAVDVTLVDKWGNPVEMGSPIDELSLRSYPNHFAGSSDARDAQFHQHRERLNAVMALAGFKRHPNEWWHFCYGDQLWAWLMQQEHPETAWVARYGAVSPSTG